MGGFKTMYKGHHGEDNGSPREGHLTWSTVTAKILLEKIVPWPKLEEETEISDF